MTAYYRVRIEVLTFRADEANIWQFREDAEQFVREHLKEYSASVEELGIQ